MTFICVECGKKATVGSVKHPYCQKCFTKVWKNDYKKFYKWLKKTHS